MTITEKIIKSHIIEETQDTIGLKIDQTLTQDATGVISYLELEALNPVRNENKFQSRGVVTSPLKTKNSFSYIDHNVSQMRPENSDDHAYLKYIAKKYKIIISPPGNGICHQLHLLYFSKPGETLIGSDSHTPTCGAVGMLCFGAGGLDVACSMAGYPYYLKKPKIVNVLLKGKLKKYLSAKDIILKLLKDLKVGGGVNKIFEYTGDIEQLDIFQRSIITNMGTELGATSSIFPSDEVTYDFLKRCGRKNVWKKILPDKDAKYDEIIELQLQELEPLIACPHSPDNVKKVKDIEGLKVDQVCIGSCTNSSLYDLILVGKVLKNKNIHPDVELIISPGSRNTIYHLLKSGFFEFLVSKGVRILEPGCGPCIGLSCVPQTGGVSLRTYNRNFVGRCGNKDAKVYLCSTEVAVASAIAGEIASPEILGENLKVFIPKDFELDKTNNFVYPSNKKVSTLKRPESIKPLPEFKPIEHKIISRVFLKLPDNISTDYILPAGSKTLHLRSNIPELSKHLFGGRLPKDDENIVVAGKNYGQGSSREHAAICSRYTGIKIVIAKSFARIHRSNLINFGILPLVFSKISDYDEISEGDLLEINNIPKILKEKNIFVENKTRKKRICLKHDLTKREIDTILKGSLINFVRDFID